MKNEESYRLNKVRTRAHVLCLSVASKAFAPCLLLTFLLAACQRDDHGDAPVVYTDVPVEFSTDDGGLTWDEPAATTRSLCSHPMAALPSPTRATNNSTDDLKALPDGFGVFAYFTDATTWAEAVSGKAVNATDYPTPDFMLNQPVTWGLMSDRTTYDWIYSPPKYWPNSTYNAMPRRISFFAYAPHISEEDIAANVASDQPGIIAITDATDKSPHISYRLGIVGSQTDLLWANCTNATRNGQGLITYSGDDKTYQRVPLRFRHALAAVDIYVQRIYDEPTYGGKEPAANEEVTKLFISQLSLAASPATYTTGTLHLEDGRWTGLGETKTSLNYAETVLDDHVSGTAKMPADANGLLYIRDRELHKWALEDYGIDAVERHLFPSSTSLLFLPQSDVTLTPSVTYTMLTQDNGLQSGYIEDEGGNRYSRIVHHTTGNQIKMSFESGKHYKLVLHIGVETVRFEVVSVEDWDFPLRFVPEVDSYQNQPYEKTINEN